MGRKEALKLASMADELYVGKGAKVLHFDLKKEKPNDDVLADALLGPTGNLRAPTIRVGRTLVVGFDEQTYDKVLRSPVSTKH
jgi:hypothetical protein